MSEPDHMGLFVNGHLIYSKFLANSSTIYPRKLTHFEGEYRTPKINPGAALISLINKELDETKNGKELVFSRLSHLVIPLGFAPSAKISV